MTANDKDKVRHRRNRNLVAKNNKHKGGYHTPDRFERKRKLTIFATFFFADTDLLERQPSLIIC